MVAPGMIFFHRTEHVFKNILLFWVLCALDVDCMEPTRSLKCDASKFKSGDYAGNLTTIMIYLPTITTIMIYLPAMQAI